MEDKTIGESAYNVLFDLIKTKVRAIRNRHVARCLTNIEELEASAEVRESVKQDMNYLTTDLEDLMFSVLEGFNNGKI